VDTPDSRRPPSRWRGSLSKAGLPFLPAGLLTLTGYNLTEASAQAYGGLASFSSPFANNRLLLNANAGLRYARKSTALPDDLTRHFSVTDYSVRADWFATPHGSLSAGLTKIYADLVNSTIVDTGLQVRW
jgi:hypothetical protein